MIITDPGQCDAVFSLQPPVISEECAIGTRSVGASTSAVITTSAMPGEEANTPVDPVQLNLNLPISLPINTVGQATLSIDLRKC